MNKKKGILVRNQDFRHLWSAKLGSLLGDWFNQVALGQVALSMTGSPSAMGIVLLARSLPNVILGPLISPVVDRYSKKSIMYACDGVRAAVVLLFPAAYMIQSFTLLWISALLLGLASILFIPAQQAALPGIVDKSDLAEANALNSGTAGVISIIGAISGGVVAAVFSPAICFIINSLTYVWSALCIYQLKWKEQMNEGNSGVPYIRSLTEGIREVSSNKVARAIIVIGISWGFAGGGYAILIPTLGKITYGMEAMGIGILYAIDGVGVLLGAIIVKRFIGSLPHRASLFYGAAYIVQALFFILLTQFSTFLLGAMMLLLMRICSGIVIPLDTYLLQHHTRPEIRGRVFSLHSSTYSGVMQLSYASLGYFMEQYGIPTVGLVIGVVSFCCGLTWLRQHKHVDNPAATESKGTAM